MRPPAPQPFPVYSPSSFDDIYSLDPAMVMKIVAQAVKRRDHATVEACLQSQVPASKEVPAELRVALRSWMGSGDRPSAELARRWDAAFGRSQVEMVTEAAWRLLTDRPTGVDSRSETRRLLALGAEPERTIGRSNMVQRAIEFSHDDGVLALVLDAARQRHPNALPTVGKRNVLDYVVQHQYYLHNRSESILLVGQMYDFTQPALRQLARAAFEQVTDDTFFTNPQIPRVKLASTFLKSGMLDRDAGIAFLSKSFALAKISCEKETLLKPIEPRRARAIEAFLGDRRWTDWTYGSMDENLHAISELLHNLSALGVDLNDQHVTGCNALEVALRYARLEVVQAALNAGVRPDAASHCLDEIAALPGMDPDKIALVRAAAARHAMQRVLDSGAAVDRTPA